MYVKRAYVENNEKLKYSYEATESNLEIFKMQTKLAAMNPRQRFFKKGEEHRPLEYLKENVTKKRSITVSHLSN